VFASRLRQGDARASLSDNHMRVAACEVVFIFGRSVIAGAAIAAMPIV
jgi:hypothetical protein